MKTALYVGLEAPKVEATKQTETRIIHLPLIKIIPKDAHEIAAAFSRLQEATHIIVTSKTTVRLAKEYFACAKKKYISVGKATTAQLHQLKVEEIETAKYECQEGIIEVIERLQLKNPFFFWPHSALSRSVLTEYFEQKNYPCIECHLYDTQFVKPQIEVDFQAIDELHFSSPSCVQAFFNHFGPPAAHIALHTIGPVTKACLDKLLKTGQPGLKSVSDPV